MAASVSRGIANAQPKYDLTMLLTSEGESSFLTSVEVESPSSKSEKTSEPTGLLSSSSFIFPSSRVNSHRSCMPRSAISAGSHSRVHTLPSSSSLYQTAVIVAVVEGRGMARGEIGIASIDLKRPELVLSQFPDSQTYIKTVTKLQILHPMEIIMPSTACEGGQGTRLFNLISDEFSDTNLSTVQRKYFNEGKGLQYIKELCVPEFNTVEMEVSNKYYCLAATAALLKYVEFIQNVVYAPSSVKVVFRGSEQTAIIDASTARNLELITNARDLSSTHCLFGVLNYTKTIGGARLLRSNILQPPCDPETIKLRLDCVQEFTDKEEMFYNLQSALKRFLDVDHLLALCIQLPKVETVKTAENKITHVICLKHVLELVDPLRAALVGSENPLLRAYCDILDDPRFGIIREQIDAVIHSDTHHQKGSLNMRTQKCFAVKPKVNGLLDIARRTYTEVVDDIAEMTAQLTQRHGLPFKTAYNNTRGFYIQLYVGPGSDPQCTDLSVDKLMEGFIKVTKHRNTLSFTTADLIRMNDRIKEALNEIYLMSNIVLNELLCKVRDHIGCLHKLSECTAMLDMLHSFAHAATLSNYVCPELTNTLAIKQGKHPVLDKISVDPPVPNNAFASGESNFVIVTGPNMSGKSTYLKQIPLIQIMAQIGSFVPAEYASIRVAGEIFSRIGSDDDIETNASSFVLEMRETNFIVQNVRDCSLVVIDELGRGTSREEGVGICYAICEHLLQTKAFTFFATHFLELTSMDNLYPNVSNYHFEIQQQLNLETNAQDIIYTHTISKGRTEESHYGLQLAEVSSTPRSVVQSAKLIAAELDIVDQAKQDRHHGKHIEESAKFNLCNRLVQAAHHSLLDADAMKEYLKHLKMQFLKEIEQCI